MNHTQEFRDAIAATGLVPPDEIIDDGKIHRFSSSGKRGDTAGWYLLHGDGIPAGRFGCNRNTDIDVKWRSNSSQELTPEQRAEYKRKMQAAKQAREADQQREREQAAAQAADLYARAVPSDDHPYLKRKKITGIGARVLDGELLIPLRHGPGALVGLQRILPDGQKFFIRGTPSGGAYHVIGKPPAVGPIVICEGYATAISIHLATGYCVVIALNAGNLLVVSQKIRKALPQARILIAADDDRWTDGNPGATAARAAADAISASVVMPAWQSEPERGHTDFNDLHCDESLDAVLACFNTEPGPASDKPGRKPDSAPSPSERASSEISDTNAGSSASCPPFREGAAVDVPDQPRVLAHPSSEADPASDDEEPPPEHFYKPARDHEDDVFIYAATPLNTAQAFQDSLPADSKVIYWRDEFYTWSGIRYCVREKVFIHQLLYKFMQSCMTIKSNPKTGDQEVIPFSPKRSNVEDVMHALCAVCYKELPEPPTWLIEQAGDVPASEIIAFRNGFLHWPTRRLMRPTSRLFITSTLDFDYEPDAPPPVEWLKFLSTIWQHDTELIDTLGEMFGYMLTDSNAHQKAFMMIGPPRSGKGTILRVLETLVGEHNRVSPSLTSIGTQFGLQSMINKRVAMISDARLSGKADQQPIIENLLRITGGDSVDVARKYLGDWSGKLNVRFVLATNETPAFNDASNALANRFIMLKFTRSFLGNEDHGLTNRLLAEMPGITMWALSGLDRLIARGRFVMPNSSSEIMHEMLETSSPISQFIAEKCVLGDGYSVGKNELFECWREWCKASGFDHPGSIVKFGRMLSACASSISRSQPRENGTRLNLYSGVRIRNTIDNLRSGNNDEGVAF